jgi:hypothetical protein
MIPLQSLALLSAAEKMTYLVLMLMMRVMSYENDHSGCNPNPLM